MLLASDVKLAEPLKKNYREYDASSQSSLANALADMKNQSRTSQIASGRTQGEYTGVALDRAGNLASQNIENSLGAKLGQASLEDIIKQQEYERNYALAKKIGSLNAPNNLMMALEGVKGAANIYGKYKGAKGPEKRSPVYSSPAYQTYQGADLNYNNNPSYSETYYD